MSSHGRVESAGDRVGPAVRWDAVLVAWSLLLPIALYYPVASVLLGRWMRFDEAYSHGLVVLAMSLWFGVGVLRRHRFSVRPAATGLVLAAVTSLGIALSQAVSVQITQQMGLVFLVWAMILGLIGWRAAWHFLFPVGLLAFAIPFWDYLAYSLQRVTTVVSGVLLGLRDIRFRIEGDTFIHLEDVGIIEVANGCSGLRYLVIALLLAAVFSRLYLRRPGHWVAMVGIALFLALLTNWVRVSALVFIGYETVMQSPLLAQHELFGWILFAVALLPFFWFGNRLIDREVRAGVGDGPGSASAPAGAGRALTRRTALAFPTVLTLAVVFPALYIGHVSGGVGDSVSIAGPTAPERLGDYTRAGVHAADSWGPVWRGMDDTVQAHYEGPGGNGVTLRAWYYQRQRPGHELIQYSNRLYDPQLWRRVGGGAAPAGTAYVELENARTGALVGMRYGYRVAGHWTTSRALAKGYQLLGLLEGRTSAALVAASSVIIPGASEETRNRLADFPMLELFADQRD